MTDPQHGSEARLLPCPSPWGNHHCAPANYYVSEWNGEQMFSRQCACGIRGPMGETEAAADAAWNSRPPQPGRVEALEKVAEEMAASLQTAIELAKWTNNRKTAEGFAETLNAYRALPGRSK